MTVTFGEPPSSLTGAESSADGRAEEDGSGGCEEECGLAQSLQFLRGYPRAARGLLSRWCRSAESPTPPLTVRRPADRQ